MSYRGAAPDWSNLEDVTVIEAAAGRARLRLEGSSDLGAVLAATRQADIVSFAYHPPTLSELFRWAVTS